MAGDWNRIYAHYTENTTLAKHITIAKVNCDEEKVTMITKVSNFALSSEFIHFQQLCTIPLRQELLTPFFEAIALMIIFFNGLIKLVKSRIFYQKLWSKNSPQISL